VNRFQKLESKVKELYASPGPDGADWVDWLYTNHVLVVQKFAKEVAETHDGNSELSQVAALLHDIADVKMKRENPDHELESLKIARDIMKECGYEPTEIDLLVDDAIKFHSCHGDERPKNKEGLVLATADALAHLKTDFYVFCVQALGKENSLDEIKDWVLKKIERDFNNKISFEDVKKSAEPDYQTIKTLFSR